MEIVRIVKTNSIYLLILTVVWTHVIDVYLINQVSSKISLYISVTNIPLEWRLVTGLGLSET